MKKTRLVAFGVASALALSLVSCGNKTDQPKQPGSSTGEAEYTINYACTVADINPLAVGATWLGQRIEELSGGRIKVNVFTNSKLGPASEFFPQMQKANGTVQMSDASPASISQFSELYSAYALPFLFTSNTQSFEYFDNADTVKAIEDKFLEETNVRVLGYFYNGTRGLTNNKRPIVVPGDVAGLKLRCMTSDVYIKTFESLGASAVSMQMAEVFTALQQGAVDGQDNGLLLTMDSKFNDVQGYYTDLDHVHDTSIIYISEDFWNTLPEDLRQVIIQAVDEAVDRERQEYVDKLDTYLEDAKQSMEVTILTDEQRAAFKKACQPVYDWYREAYPDYDLDAIMKDIENY